MRVLALVGPTAVGKSAVALALAGGALRAPVEILNADAMQLYRGMDIGTAKVDAAGRAQATHHLLDIWPVTHRASVVEYRDLARGILRPMAEPAVPIMVGGSGLYLAATLDQLDIPATDPDLRAGLERRLAELGPAALHAQLAGLDPQAAAVIDPNNGRRIVRALEVVQLTGSFAARLPATPEPWIDTRWIGLRAPMEQLDRIIAARVEGMWDNGLMDEVEALVDAGLRAGPTASKAVGYAECLAFLDGQLSRSEAIAATAARTRKLARRQLRWFRRDPRVQWIDVPAAASPQQVADQVASGWA